MFTSVSHLWLQNMLAWVEFREMKPNYLRLWAEVRINQFLGRISVGTSEGYLQALGYWRKFNRIVNVLALETNRQTPFSQFKVCSVNWFSSQACRKRLKNTKPRYNANKTKTTNYKELSNRWRKISTGWRKRFKNETKPFKIRYFLFDLFTMLFFCLFVLVVMH